MNGTIEGFLRGKQMLCIDSMVIIYFIEENPAYLPVLIPLFERIDSGVVKAFSSFITLTEVLTKPFEVGRMDLVEEYRDRLLGNPGFTLFPVEKAVSERTAYLRAHYRLRTPDAIQIATALEHGAQAFLTNDDRLSGVREIEIVTLRKLARS